jgi:hypothetical protein
MNAEMDAEIRAILLPDERPPDCRFASQVDRLVAADAQATEALSGCLRRAGWDVSIGLAMVCSVLVLTRLNGDTSLPVAAWLVAGVTCIWALSYDWSFDVGGSTLRWRLPTPVAALRLGTDHKQTF